jgi:hypothetical protein
MQFRRVQGGIRGGPRWAHPWADRCSIRSGTLFVPVQPGQAARGFFLPLVKEGGAGVLPGLTRRQLRANRSVGLPARRPPSREQGTPWAKTHGSRGGEFARTPVDLGSPRRCDWVPGDRGPSSRSIRLPTVRTGRRHQAFPRVAARRADEGHRRRSRSQRRDPGSTGRERPGVRDLPDSTSHAAAGVGHLRRHSRRPPGRWPTRRPPGCWLRARRARSPH